MGILDFIKPKSALEKAAKQVREEYAQPDYRRGAMDKLLEIGTPEAYDALLRRFSVTAHGQIADEQEKKDLVEELVRIGEPAVGAIERYIRSEAKGLTFPIRALIRIQTREQAVETLLDVLAQYEPLDHRSTQAKVALIDALGGLLGQERSAVLLPYLDDHHDDVQASVIEVIEHLRPDGAPIELSRVCKSDLHSSRVKRQAARTLASLQASVRTDYAAFDPELKESWVLGKKGQLVPRAGA